LKNNAFSYKLITWYESNKRDLPFRNTTDSYKIWLSEIILQQTRVAQGLSYYERFVKKFPTVVDLAAQSEETILKEWQGLGYYSRARNLHHTAKYVVVNYQSIFPTSYIELIKLKGIGDYTASAISSFSSKEVRPVLDGNVYRFISRLYGVETPINTTKSVKEFKLILEELIDKDKPDIFNQAMIEFGALHCVPTSPSCESCIFQESCFAFSKNRVNEFPVKLKKKKSIERYVNFMAIQQKDGVWLVKRTEDAIWKNLYEFPNLESEQMYTTEQHIQRDKIRVKISRVARPIKHVLSHQNIYAKLFICEPTEDFTPQTDWIFVPNLQFRNYPIHRLMEKMIERELKGEINF